MLYVVLKTVLSYFFPHVSTSFVLYTIFIGLVCQQVQVGKSLWVPLQTHLQALHACSPGRMIRPLLRRAFSRRRLVKSTYAGQKRKRNGIEVVKPGLKKYQKMADIHGMVLATDSL